MYLTFILKLMDIFRDGYNKTPKPSPWVRHCIYAVHSATDLLRKKKFERITS